MHRVGRIALVTIALAATAPAAADPTQVGGWFGPRIFSTDSLLGYIENAPAHPMLENSVELGVRVARPLFPWLVPEFELAVAPASTQPAGGAPSVGVFWMEPRLHMRFELWPDRRLRPFLVAGGGAPIALSMARKTFDSGIVGDGYVGAGLRFTTGKGFVLRFDARLAVLPGADNLLTTEVDVGFGVEFAIGVRRPRASDERLARESVADKDNDGIVDANDRCPDRPEDADGFEDLDGCSDIDNDLDRVLDIADQCPNVAEPYNGYEDDDGCPDIVPPAVDMLRGTIEGLLYADGETIVRNSAQPQIRKIAKLMQSHPSIKVVVTGHTDRQEAKQFATSIEGQPPADLDALSAELSRARAEAVKQALVVAGVPAPRVHVEGRGAEDPVSNNDRPRGRLANRRVEIKLFVPRM